MKLAGASVSLSDGRPHRENITALHNITLEVSSGEKLGVIGKNGSGKTTLLRLMAGIFEPDKGTFDAEGDHVGLLSLNTGFDSNLTGVQNIIMHGMLMGLSYREATSRVEDVRAISELSDDINRPLITYSSGMRARFCFATVIMLDPDILLVDEILAVGDASFKDKSLAMMRERFHGNRGVVFVSHSLPMVSELCDRVVWLDAGTIRQVGNPADVIAAYKSETA